MFSPSCGDLVLIDFGISCAVKEKPGCRSLTYKEGTLRFMSEEMKALDLGGKGYVDLYWNDVHALTKSLQEIRESPGSRILSFEWISSNALSEVQEAAVKCVYEQYMNSREGKLNGNINCINDQP